MNKENKKETKTKTKTQPKWGTEEWVKSHPYSKMDKDRKRRVRNLLGIKCDAPFPIRSYVGDAIKALNDVGLDLNKKDRDKLASACATVEDFLVSAQDELIARQLLVKWGIIKPTKPTKPCKKACKSECKAKCDSKCKKGKKA